MYQNKLEEKLLKNADTSGITLVVGSKVYNGKVDRRTLYPNAIGIDMQAGEGVDVVCDITNYAELSRVEGLDNVSHIDCVSILEHCHAPIYAVCNLVNLCSLGGATIFITVPFVWREHAYPDDYYRFTKNGLIEMCSQVGLKIETAFYVSGGKKVSKPPVIEHEGVPYFGRTEVYAFGRVV